MRLLNVGVHTSMPCTVLDRRCAMYSHGVRTHHVGVDLTAAGSAGQLFLNSVYRQYADWGLDFIKNDCVFADNWDETLIRGVSEVRSCSHGPLRIPVCSFYAHNARRHPLPSISASQRLAKSLAGCGAPCSELCVATAIMQRVLWPCPTGHQDSRPAHGVQPFSWRPHGYGSHGNQHQPHR